MTTACISERVHELLRSRAGEPACTWFRLAAQAFEEQLEQSGAPTHREVVAPLAEWLQLAPAEAAAIGEALDLLQVAFDFADNLADAEEDLRRGRSFSRWYAAIPSAVAPCVPALACSLALERLVSAFPGRSAHAVQRVVGVLADMTTGQGSDDLDLQTELISGKQALLLCLPLWVTPEHAELDAASRAGIERWAVLWGNTWQRAQHQRDAPCAASHFALRQAAAQAIDNWPSVGPFAAGGALSSARCFPCGLC